MRFSTEVYTSDLGRILPAFVAISGWSEWQKRLNELEGIQRKSPVWRNYLDQAHSIEFEVSRTWHSKRVTGRFPRKIGTASLYRLASLANAVVGINKRLTSKGQVRLHGMLRDALNNDFLSIEHEMRVATHLLRRGFDIELADIENIDRFDLLAKRDGREIEVECKTVGYDLGRKIHRYDFLHLAERLYPAFKAHTDRTNQSKLLVVSLIDRLHGSDQRLSSLAALVLDVLEGRRAGVTLPELSIRSDPYNPQRLPPDDDTLRQEIARALGIDQFHVFIQGNDGAAVILVVHSRRPDRVVSYILKQLRGAAQQFTTTKPAILWTQIRDVEPHEWRLLASNSAIQRMSALYMQSVNRAHVHTVAYSSTGRIERRDAAVTDTGPVLYFRNANHKLRLEQALQIFA